MFICPSNWFTVPQKELTEQQKELNIAMYGYLNAIECTKRDIVIAEWQGDQNLVEQLNQELEQYKMQLQFCRIVIAWSSKK